MSMAQLGECGLPQIGLPSIESCPVDHEHMLGIPIDKQAVLRLRTCQRTMSRNPLH